MGLVFFFLKGVPMSFLQKWKIVLYVMTPAESICQYIVMAHSNPF